MARLVKTASKVCVFVGFGGGGKVRFNRRGTVCMYSHVRVVLMGTSHPGNIGAVARAMKNMGLENLVLVAPRAAPDGDSMSRAAGALDVLDKAKTFSTLEEAVADCSLVIGASARNRKIPWPVMNPRDCAEKVYIHSRKESVALVFGREDRGLSNEELQRCNFHVHIPSNPEFSSLNLGMAVQVICYELRMKYLVAAENDGNVPQMEKLEGAGSEGWDELPATVSDVEGMLTHLERTMVATEFLDPDNPRQLVARLRRLYQRVALDKVEVNILRGFLTSVNRLVK